MATFIFIVVCYESVNLDVSTIYYIILRPVALVTVDYEAITLDTQDNKHWSALITPLSSKYFFFRTGI